MQKKTLEPKNGRRTYYPSLTLNSFPTFIRRIVTCNACSDGRVVIVHSRPTQIGDYYFNHFGIKGTHVPMGK